MWQVEIKHDWSAEAVEVSRQGISQAQRREGKTPKELIPCESEEDAVWLAAQINHTRAINAQGLGAKKDRFRRAVGICSALAGITPGGLRRGLRAGDHGTRGWLVAAAEDLACLLSVWHRRALLLCPAVRREQAERRAAERARGGLGEGEN